MQTKVYPITKQKQQGAVLMVSLLILVVLTLIGLSNMDGNVMEEKMAANSQISTTAFQAAESAIRATYYEENKVPELAYLHAQSRATADRSTYDVTSDTLMVVHTTETNDKGNARNFNTSENTAVSRSIEIIGTAETRGIQESNAQGYTIHNLRP